MRLYPDHRQCWLHYQQVNEEFGEVLPKNVKGLMSSLAYQGNHAILEYVSSMVISTHYRYNGASEEDRRKEFGRVYKVWQALIW